MEIRYQSTRSSGETVTASQAILKGLADDGGAVCAVKYSEAFSIFGRYIKNGL